MRRLIVTTALMTGMLGAGVGVASAAESGYVSGYEGAGLIMNKTTTPGENCATRRAFYVVHTDDPELPSAWRADSAPGAGQVCVSRATYDSKHVGNWWSGRASGPRG